MAIEICEKAKCSGCSACASICPKNCISMVRDEEGFLYPKINEENCINCNLCEKICPIINNNYENKKGKAVIYAVKNKNEEIRASSSSGGVFTAIAEKVLENGGVVFGSAFDDKFHLRHICVDNKHELSKLRGSKYLQSEIGETYKQVKSFLNSGRQVLFTGTPCQVGGLYAYLKKDYDNLLTQDLICHGCPSPMAWEKYLEYREAQAGSKIKNVSFRSKKIGWKNFSMEISFLDGNEYCENLNNDLYMKAFLRNYNLRPSCYKCSFRYRDRKADITLADFWGVDVVMPKIDDDMGTSLVVLHTKKGKEMFNKICGTFNYTSVTDNRAIDVFNSSMIKSPNRPIARNKFLRLISEMPFDKALEKAEEKVGIITLYIWSHNYGGILQAYALCKVLNKNNINAEQICYNAWMSPPAVHFLEDSVYNSTNNLGKKKWTRYFNPFKIYRKIKVIIKHYKQKRQRIKEKKNHSWIFKNRAIDVFKNKIPHSQEMYYKDTISLAKDKYSMFITGSDQVWNPDWFNIDAYLLKFVEGSNKKISYAASIGHSTLSDIQKEMFKNSLADYKAISVREDDAVDLLQPLVPGKKIVCALDPTLLINRDDWENITSKRLIRRKYLFCYIFDEDQELRSLAKEYAKVHKLKIVNIPHINEWEENPDIDFADIEKYDAGIEDFLSLIKYSECVFTNSFHACVFSAIFERNFYVFNRKSAKKMGGRITSLCTLFDCQSHYIKDTTKANTKILDDIGVVDYAKDFSLLKTRKKESLEFLMKNLTK